ncbi:hypothetical protein GCM10011502_30050 [Oceanisphaera marina]|uniref:CobQ/CobB/MinD/ParA nucleotide binding domain-containing protein n=1 Tax=Oceanisphaera marina TaxID=2017550 RepID=A0ABQ1IZH1_9GAMM|nr:ParA family protein [Oceanisphaera marina]GGB55077.1 hypothetical protein GCM10011502_30050 [Oceanisphaera marina]
MQVISVWSPKGGAGKTTITLNLAGAYSAQGLTVLVVDLDPQQSAAWVYSRGRLPFEVVAGMPKKKPKADVVLFDHPPGVGDVPTVGKVVMPIRPSALDIHSASLMAGQLNAEQAIYRVVNAVDVRRREEREVSQELRRQGAFVIGSRSSYPRATGEGVTVWQVNYSGANEARNEIKILADAVLKGDL